MSSAMSLCVQRSVKHPYCFTFVPPYALKQTLGYCKRSDFPCLSCLSGNRCLNMRSGITLTSAPLSILHFTSTSVSCPVIFTFAKAWDLLPFLNMDSSFASGVVSIVSNTKSSSALSLSPLSLTVCSFHSSLNCLSTGSGAVVGVLFHSFGHVFS